MSSRHDPLCPDPDWRVPEGISCADCDRLRRVRADERERIAAAIEAHADDLDWDDAIAATLTGDLVEVRDYGKTLLHTAARIARNGGLE